MDQEIHFCMTSDNVRIAYAVVGHGPILLHIPGWIGHLELDWQRRKADWEAYADHFTVVRFDKRGTGLSDRNVGDCSVERRVLDAEAVLSHVGAAKIHLMGTSEGGATCIVFAARHGDQIERMVLRGAYAAGDSLFGTASLREAIRALIGAEWGLGTGLLSTIFLGDNANPDVRDFFGLLQRQGAEPEDALSLLAADYALNVASVLPHIHVPTLVVQAREDKVVSFETGRDLAACIPQAHFASVDGGHVPSNPDQSHQVRTASLSFLLTGTSVTSQQTDKGAPKGGELATILFTDMVGSTRLTQRLGDEKAQDILRIHNTVVRDALRDYGGKETKHTGDGIMASFSSVSSAVRCGIAMQRAFADTSVEIRVGINAGEPVEENKDFFGTAVQMAARVCAQSKPREILVTNVIVELSAGKGFGFAKQHQVILRGFDSPVQLFRVEWHE